MNFETDILKTGRFTENQKKGLKKMGIETVRDLFYYFPKRYGSFSDCKYIQQLQDGEEAIIYATVTSIEMKKAWKSKMTMTEAILEESSEEKIKAIWFSQPYISKMLQVGQSAYFFGKISIKKGNKVITNPEFKNVSDKIPLEKTGALFAENSEDKEKMIFPVYKETKGISSKWIFHKIKKILSNRDFLESLQDPIPTEILKKYNLPSLKNSLFYLHLPKKEEDAQAAKKRFAFEEIFFIQLVKGLEKEAYKKSGAFVIRPTKEIQKKFLSLLDFKPTMGQGNAINDILEDFKKDIPMSRLLEGDVGAGKTVVAAAAAYFTVMTTPKNQNFGSLQVAYMAPTEILAKQIFAEFCSIFKNENIKIGLLTGKDVRVFPSKIDSKEVKVSKKKMTDWILNGEIKILIGTHALISKNVFFENLGLAIIDEQHRFGKKQRAKLRAKPVEKKQKLKNQKKQKIQKKGLAKNEDILPHLLSMTATPIPRTLALSIYGDLDLTILDELPPGRQKVKTEIFFDNEMERKKVYQEVKKELQKGRQVFVICPRIDEPDPNKKRAMNVASAIATQKRLQEKEFKKYRIGLLHSKLSKEQKNDNMQNFVDGKTDILVATSMVEVGVSVANATVMIIEGGQSFGLSQLHQFRGRVMRSSHQPYCYIFAQAKTEKTLQRMKALKTAKNGFELAEYDLQFRGAGEVMGNKQSGMSDLAMEAISNIKMVEAARNEAQKLAKKEEYKKHKNLTEKLEFIRHKIYLE